MESMETKGDEGDRLFNLAMKRFEAASSSTLDNRFTLKSWGDALAEQSKRKTGEEREKLISLANEKYVSIESQSSLLQLAMSLSKQAQQQTGPEKIRLYKLSYQNFKAAAQCSRKINHDGSATPTTLNIMRQHLLDDCIVSYIWLREKENFTFHLMKFIESLCDFLVIFLKKSQENHTEIQ